MGVRRAQGWAGLDDEESATFWLAGAVGDR